jgi:phospholipase/carboxylesterase
MTDPLEAYVHLHRPGPSRRTLLLLHGTGGDEQQFLRLGAMVDPEASLLSLRGNVDEHGMSRFFSRLAEGVYDMADLELRTDQLAAFVEAARGRWAIGDLVGIGYSNGANILASLLFARPELVPTAVLMHPLIPFAPEPQSGLAGSRVLITAGERDPICPLPLTLSLHARLEAQGATAELVLHPGGHELRPSELEAIRGFLAA